MAVAFIATVAVLLAVGAGIAYKLKYADAKVNAPSAAVKPLKALPPGAATTIVPPHAYRGLCFSCHPLATDAPVSGGQPPQPIAAPPLPPPAVRGFSSPPMAAGQPPLAAAGDITQAALAPPPMNTKGAGLLSPVEQNAADKVLVEGHWLGMELMDLTPALRKIYGLTPEVQGVIVDEITLESAESGILAGDVVIRVGDQATPDLRGFLKATEAVKDLKTVEVVVNRRGAEKRYSLTAKNTSVLGFAQVEGAQPIKPGALSPHRGRRRACTECHVMMASGGQLPVDEGDITVPPPSIPANAKAPHAFRGVCNSCHVIQANPANP